MSELDRVDFTYAHPVPNRDHTALLASLSLLLEHAAECLPVGVKPSGPVSYFEDWEVTRAAFMARMASTLRHLGYLAPSYSQLDGFALTRTLVEHAITFAWISGDPAERLPKFVRSSFSRMLDKDKAARKRGEPLVDDQSRGRLQEYVKAHQVDMPGLPRRAEEADEAWHERVTTTLPESMSLRGFRLLYDDVYDHYSAYDHPSSTGLQVFVHLAGEPVVATVDGQPERDLERDLRPYWIAVFAFAEALIVSHAASGLPRLKGLRQTLELIGTVRLLERDGRLAVAETDDGTMTIGPVTGDDDEPPAG